MIGLDLLGADPAPRPLASRWEIVAAVAAASSALIAAGALMLRWKRWRVR